MEAPESLAAGGRVLWSARCWPGMPDDAAVMLLEACRAKDRLDKLDELLRGEIDCWARLTHRTLTEDYELRIDAALAAANATAGVMSRLLSALAQRPTKPAPGGEQGEGGVVVDFTARLTNGAGSNT